MRVLIVKTSSMGDVIHTLPALTDALAARNNLIFDWVVEENFAEIPSWHPGVDRVIPCAIRRWRKNIFKTWHSPEWKLFKNELKKYHYDLVIDCQGLLKSAWLTSLVSAPVAGYDKRSVREPLASLFYRHKYSVSKQLHAVERIRQLFALALNYPQPSTDVRGSYGIDPEQFLSSQREPKNLVFLHSTTREDKHYPEIYWRRLADMLSADGYKIRLPWGTEQERARAERLAEGSDAIEVLPRLNIHGVATVLAQANAVVAVDTGLGHLSAALNIPTISLYGPTEPGLIGAYGDNQIHLKARDFDAVDEQIEPQVFAPLKPEIVYRQLQNLLPQKSARAAQ